MPDEVTPSLEQGTVEASEAPTDYREYARWRTTGELPEQKEDTPAAAGTGADATEAQAETEPDSEPEKTQDAGEDNEREDGGRKNRPGSRERKLERALAEIEELKRQVAQPPQDKPSQPAAATGKPKLEDFQTLEAYQEALTDWKFDERERARKESDARTAAEDVVRKQQESWGKKEKAARKAHEDYDDLMETVQIPAGPGVLAARQAMLEDEHGAELLYHLAKHPKELERIAGLSPASAVMAIGRLSATFDKPPATENGKPKITGAPKPPPPSGRAAKVISDDPNDPDVQRDFKRWTKAREAQIRGR